MKILVVDDSKMWRSMLKDFFSSKGWLVESAGDGLEGYFKMYETLPDAVISDVVMPGLNGYQLCRLTRLDERMKGIPFIILTGSDDNVSRFWSIYAGATAYIEKTSQGALERTYELLRNSPSEKKENIEPQNGKDVFESFLDKLLTDTTLKAEMRQLSSHIEDMDYTVHKLYNFLKSMFGFEAFALMIVSVDELVLYTSVEEPKWIEGYLLSQMKKPHFPKTRTYKHLQDSKAEKHLPTQIDVVTFEDEEEGVLALWRRESFSYRESKIMETISQELGVILKNTVQIKRYKKGAYVDELTDMANFRALEEYLEELWKSGKEFELSIFDIDHFKRVNDTYGHEVGNEVLSGLGKLLRDFAEKRGNFVGRFGGEEFIMVKEGKRRLFQEVEEVRKAVERARLSTSIPELKITVSAGVAYSNGLGSVTAVIETADKMLYEAKKSGRNKVVGCE